MKDKKNKKNSVRQPEIKLPTVEEPKATIADAESVISDEEAPQTSTLPTEFIAKEEPSPKAPTLNELTEIDPELLTGRENDQIKVSKKIVGDTKKYTENKVVPSEINLEGDGPREDDDIIIEADGVSSHKKNRGLAFVVFGIIALLAIVVGTLFFEAGGEEILQSPLSVNGKSISSAEFSFMYHYTMIYEGVDLLAPGTKEMLASEYLDDERYATHRDYFLNLTAQRIQTMEILYDDATENGYKIEAKHYTLAQSYIDWLKGNADELGVPLNTYIKGIYGKQVDEQIVLETLAKKYFTDDYANGAKLEELSATSEQAEEAYQADRNTYDVVSYKILRITYEQREDAFINTANLHANQIIDKMNGNPAKFEAEAAKFFSGAAAEALAAENSTLVPDCRYGDFSHADFRDWLFNPARKSGDSTIFKDEDGFPIILVFVDRDRMKTPVRNVYISHIIPKVNEDGSVDMSGAQSLSQEVYDYINDESSCEQLENIFNDYVLSGNLSVTHSIYSYCYEYEKTLNDWIFDDSRTLGNKALIENGDSFYVMYYIEESVNPEWYDRVNSFLRMNNYQEFIDEKSEEYTYAFNASGLEKIQDVPNN